MIYHKHCKYCKNVFLTTLNDTVNEPICVECMPAHMNNEGLNKEQNVLYGDVMFLQEQVAELSAEIKRIKRYLRRMKR